MKSLFCAFLSFIPHAQIENSDNLSLSDKERPKQLKVLRAFLELAQRKSEECRVNFRLQ
jgi:hypothetical protein